MATVFTTTQTDILAPAGVPAVVRNMSTGSPAGSMNGHLYVIGRPATDTLTVYRSTDQGGSWASYASFTQTGIQEWSGLVIDKFGYGHLSYRIGTGTADTLYYRRLNLYSASWSGSQPLTSNDANSGVIGSRWQGLDIAVVHNSNNTYTIATFAAYTEGSTRYGIYVHGISIDGSGTIYNNDSIVSGNRSWLISGTAPGRSGVSCELEHTGDGITSSTPHLWVTFGRTSLRMIKLSWQGYSSGWSGPSGYQTIRSTITAQNYAAGRWDGKHWMMPVISPDDSTIIRVYERNQANTATTTYDTPTHPTGSIRQWGISYDASTFNIRVFGVGTSTGVLYYTDYNRGTSIWSAWSIAVATAVLGPDEWGVRRGGTSGNSRHDVVTTASGAPNTITHTALSISSVPNIAVWDVSGQPYLNGGAANSSAALTLAWIFFDPDAGQTQGSYALSRQIGAGTVQYYTAAGGTWGATEVQNSTATPSVTLASGWSSATDANYTFKVKVWDSTNAPAPGYSSAMVLTPSALVNPAITAPTAAQVLSTDTVTMTWTAAEQTQRRVRLLTNPGGLVVYDSGFVVDPALSFTPPYRMANGTGWTIELTTKNNEGLASTPQTRAFTVVYSPPPPVISVLTPSTTLGRITVVSSALAPVGPQPALATMDLYRRANTTPILNSNSTFAGNVTGYAVGGVAGTATLSYSTVQFHEGTGAARLVPTSGATPNVESSTVVIDPTKVLFASGWVRPDTANKPLQILINWYTSAGAYISTASATLSSPIALAWQYLELTADPNGVAGVGRATIALGLTSTPLSTDAIYVDELELRALDTTTGVRIAAGMVHPATVNDYGAASGIDYEYRWTATGANGTTIAGPWTA